MQLGISRILPVSQHVRNDTIRNETHRGLRIIKRDNNEWQKRGSAAMKTAYFAGGCFWGVEHLMRQQDGVLDVVSGYMGGHQDNPSYREVCNKTTGHLEAVEVSYDPERVDYETLAKLFFEIHDPTQMDGQGPDLGEQYASAVFVDGDEERATIEKLIGILQGKGLKVATKVLPLCRFWKAEEYHQNYYAKTGKEPYCHFHTPRF